MKVVFLHALPLNGRMWDGQRAALAQHDTEAPDLYPLGSSMEEWADALLERIDGPFVAVGASMGGYCAGAIALKDRSRLRGVALLGSRAAADPPERRPARDQWIEVARTRGAEGLWQEMRGGLFPEGADEAVVAHAHALALEQSGDDLGRAVAAIRDRPDATAALTGDIPLLVVAGGRDTLVPAGDAQALAAAAPNARYEELDCGHLPNLERPGDVNRILDEWLSTLS